jgi:hypothetical protein
MKKLIHRGNIWMAVTTTSQIGDDIYSASESEISAQSALQHYHPYESLACCSKDLLNSPLTPSGKNVHGLVYDVPPSASELERM